MIGQHIYSRCTEGYFSHSGSKGDSTTVTISRDMFAREDQAKIVARECEAIGTLEDIRPVPSVLTGAYRGVLKVKRLNQQLTVVSRAYRLRAKGNASGERNSGEFRDFTYSSSYILAGEDKERFFREPEYALNLQNFESYPSVQARIEDSKRNGAYGRIEANPEYTLFKNPQKKIEFRIFELAGFTEELFIDYISSLIQRVGYMEYSGHENDKVLVILPDPFRPDWNAAGGNGYAEQVLAATLKLLPDFISQNISAVSCGGENPDASILKGYQLIFMESGFTKEWVSSEYSIIDLQNKKSYVSAELDTSYGRFLWNVLDDTEKRAEFEKQYIRFFGEERVYENANIPEMFTLLFGLIDGKKQNFADQRSREQLILGVSYYMAGNWTEDATGIFKQMLQCEMKDPGFSDNIRDDLIELLQQQVYAEENLDEIMICLTHYLISENASESYLKFMQEAVEAQNPLAEEKLCQFLKNIQEQPEAEWDKKDSLRNFLVEVCKDRNVPYSSPVKSLSFSLLKSWYRKCVNRNEWEHTSQMMEALSQPLNDGEITDENMEELSGSLYFQLFYGDADSQKQAHDLLVTEEKKLSNPSIESHRFSVLWNCFKEQCSSEGTVLNTRAIWHLVYFATARDRKFLNVEWKSLYEYLVSELGEKCKAMVFDETAGYLHKWLTQVPKKRAIIQEAIYISECVKIRNCQSPEGYSDTAQIQRALQDLSDSQQPYDSMLLYEWYQHTEADRKSILLEQLHTDQRWKIMIQYMVQGEEDPILAEYMEKNSEQTAEFLSNVKEEQWLNEEMYAVIVENYFKMLTICCQKRYDDNQLRIWCDVFQKEVSQYPEIFGRDSEIERKLKNKFLSRTAKMNPHNVFGLNAGQIQFLKRMIDECGKRKNFSKDWRCLDLLWFIYYGKDVEKLGQMQNMLLNSREIPAYLTPVEERIRREKDPDCLLFFAMLQEQLSMIMDGRRNFVPVNVIRKIYGPRYSNAEAVFSAMQLLFFTERLPLVGSEEIRSACQNEVMRQASSNSEAFANNDIAAAYQLLKEDTARELRLGRFLSGLDDEWKSVYCKKYGRTPNRRYSEPYGEERNRRSGYDAGRSREAAYEEEEKDSPVLLIVTGVIAALLGIAVSLVLCLLIPDNITLIISIVLILVGIIGDIVLVVRGMMESKRRKR